MTKPKVLVIVGDATETVDTLYPYYRIIEAGMEPVVAAPELRRYQMVLHEVKPGWTITKEWEGYTIKADVAFADVDPDEYLGIFFSGGRAPEYIRYDEDLVRITRHFFEAGKLVSQPHHAIAIRRHKFSTQRHSMFAGLADNVIEQNGTYAARHHTARHQ